MADNSHEKSEVLEAEAVFFVERAEGEAGSIPPTMMGVLSKHLWEGPF